MNEPGYSPEFTATSRGMTAEALLREAVWLARFDGTYDALDLADRIDEFLAAGRSSTAPITVNVENLPVVELCMKRLAALGEFLDRLHDEAFPNDPYLLGRLHAEMERLGYGSIKSSAQFYRYVSTDDEEVTGPAACLRLTLHAREHDGESGWERHPTLADLAEQALVTASREAPDGNR